ncbi:hypothetical protein NM688_g1898 [Phlebia brevispora]|uniref:Uncharacterized protein n=1 Tax=Phlebia brevispora TaxID=194682 RepID=A0ACC1TAI6_9APHY|nr:hypothetical protein NM688_g1898 [Phlebia brevispora]
MRWFSRVILSVAHGVLRNTVADQGASSNGPDNPLRLWIVQAGIIILTTQLLALLLKKIRQPKVIAEIVGGIILGPTAFGRIPGFQRYIFPSESQTYLSLVANIGLCLFLFLIGLEIDGSVIRRNARLSAVVALGGMLIPFALGSALAVPLYHQFIDPSIRFTNFMLFTGVAYSITSFPVLCRILAELKLLDTTVGIVVISAGVGNDIVGWSLLALSVALVNAGSGLNALWTLFMCLGWSFVLLFPIRYALYWLARQTGSVTNGPTMSFMTVTILILFGSAFVTDVIGVHAIFGAFLAGIIVPREGNLTSALTEKLEDMVSVIFLPLVKPIVITINTASCLHRLKYFALSGLSTNLGLLNDRITWTYVAAICTLSYSGKFGSCTVAARFVGFSWREASMIGSLMSCKGLVGLIVLNVGLSEGILSPRVFSMFVLEALLLTFMTTPAVLLLRPPEKRKCASSFGSDYANDPELDNEEESSSNPDMTAALPNVVELLRRKNRFTVVLDKTEHLPGMMALAALMQPPADLRSEGEDSRGPYKERSIILNALHLIALSDHTPAVTSSVSNALTHTTPLLDIFRTFGELSGMTVDASLSIVPREDLANSIAEFAKERNSQLILMPWLAPQESLPDDATVQETVSRHSPTNVNYSSPVLHSRFVRNVFAQSTRDIALFINANKLSSAGPLPTSGRYHIFLPFFGGPDGRLALEFVVRCCLLPGVSATVVRFTKVERSCHSIPEDLDVQKTPPAAQGDKKRKMLLHDGASTVGYGTFIDSPKPNVHAQFSSGRADGELWERYAIPSQPYTETLDSATKAALSRIKWEDVSSSSPLYSMVEYAFTLERVALEKRSKPMVVLGRSRSCALENREAELKQLMDKHGSVSSEVVETAGDVASALLATNTKSSIVVLQVAPAVGHCN